MRALLIHNPIAGSGKSLRFTKRIVELFAKHGITLETRHLTLGINPFDDALDTELAIVCGGDGSINYVVNCMRELGINPTLGIIPMGTANDFANALDLPMRPIAAAKRILDGTVRNIDCCKVNDRYFVNIFSFGIFTSASQRTPRAAKKQFGKLAYLKPGIDDIRTMRPIRIQFKTDRGVEYNGSVLVFLAFNGITAGRMMLTRQSRPDDGLMEIVALESRHKIYSYGDIARYILGGNPDAVRHFRCSEIEVTSSQHRITDIDGERGPNFPLHITCEKGALKIKM